MSPQGLRAGTALRRHSAEAGTAPAAPSSILLLREGWVPASFGAGAWRAGVTRRGRARARGPRRFPAEGGADRDGRGAARRSGRHRACALRTEHPRSAEPAGAEVTRAAAPVQPPGAAMRDRPGGGQRAAGSFPQHPGPPQVREPREFVAGALRGRARPARLPPPPWGASALRRAAAAAIAAGAARRARNGARFGSSGREQRGPSSAILVLPVFAGARGVVTAHGAVAALRRPQRELSCVSVTHRRYWDCRGLCAGRCSCVCSDIPSQQLPRTLPGWGRSAGNSGVALNFHGKREQCGAVVLQWRVVFHS